MLNKYYDCMSYSFLEYCGMAENNSVLVVKLLVVLVSLDVNLSFHVINASVIFRLINVAYLEFIS